MPDTACQQLQYARTYMHTACQEDLYNNNCGNLVARMTLCHCIFGVICITVSCIPYSGHNPGKNTRLKVKEIHYDDINDASSLSQSNENDEANYEEIEHHGAMVSHY